MNARASAEFDRSSKSPEGSDDSPKSPDFERLSGTNRAARGSIVMLNCVDLEPVFFAPFVSSVMTVEPAWIDYNGHLNMAYYNVLFDRGIDEAYALVGIGEDYRKNQQQTMFSAEVHIRYLRELRADDPVRVTFQLLAYDSKRLHFFQQLFHATESWVSATSENLSLHIDLGRRKTAPFPAEVARSLAKMRKSHAHLPRPEAAGRRIAMPEKG